MKNYDFLPKLEDKLHRKRGFIDREEISNLIEEGYDLYISKGVELYEGSLEDILLNGFSRYLKKSIDEDLINSFFERLK